MELQQSFCGDVPSVGFAPRTFSAGFPAGIRWIEQSNDVRLETVNPDATNKGNGLHEVNSTYELQSLCFGKLSAIKSSSSFYVMDGRMSGRQHSFTQIIAFPNQEGKSAAESWEPNQLVAFQNYLSVRDFWNMRPSYTLSPIGWDPQEKQPCAVAGDLSAMDIALLCRYWQSASRRTFVFPDIPLKPILVTMADADDEQMVFERAKELITQLVVPALPRAVFNILSVSAGLSANGIGRCNPTAMVVLLPGNTAATANPLHFDYRTNTYVELTAMEAAFMADVLRRETPSLLQTLYQRYCERIANVSLEACPLMADYQVAFCAWYQQRRMHQGNAQSAVDNLRTLYKLLHDAHKLTPVKIEYLLADFEKDVFDTIQDDECPISKENFIFLMERASKAPDDVYQKQVPLLIVHQNHDKEPFFLRAWQAQSTNFERLSLVMEAILTGSYLPRKLTENQRNAMMDNAFVAYCENQPCIKKVVEQYLETYTKRYPEQALFMLPLSVLFLDGYSVLGQNIRILQTLYTEELPDQANCESIAKSKSFLNEENRRALDEFYLRCFLNHRDAPLSLADTVRFLGVDTTHAICRIFSDEEQKVAEQEPLSAQQIIQLLKVFAPNCAQKQDMAAAYRSMLTKVLESSVESGVDRFAWYESVMSIGNLLDVGDMQAVGIGYLCDYSKRVGTLPAQVPFATICSWLSHAKDTSQQQNRIKSLLETMMPASEDYARQHMNVLGSVQPYPQLRQLLITMTKQSLLQGWGSTGLFWKVLENHQNMMKCGGITYSELEDERTVCQARLLLKDIMSAAGSTSRFSTLLNEAAVHADNSFCNYWMEALSSAFVEQYDKLFAECRTYNEVVALLELVGQINVAPKLLNVPGYINSQLVQETNTLLHGKPEVMTKNRLLEDVLGLARRIMSRVATSSYTTLSAIVTAMAEQSAAEQDFVNACILLLLPANIHNAKMDANYLLTRCFAWSDTLIKKPFADENLPTLQQLLFVFSLANEWDVLGTSMSEALLQALCEQSPYREYTEKVRASKSTLKSCFPALFDKKAEHQNYLPQYAVQWLQG